MSWRSRRAVRGGGGKSHGEAFPDCSRIGLANPARVTNFAHYDYVSPRAPKAGTVRRGVTGTFDNFNMAVNGVKGVLAAGIELIFETLLTPSLDEVSSEYGLLAEAVTHPADFSSVTYRLRAEARWHDGTPIAPRDVVLSLHAFKKLNRGSRPTIAT